MHNPFTYLYICIVKQTQTQTQTKKNNMTKKTAQRNGWTIGRVINGGWFARKGLKFHAAPTLKVLLTKLFIVAVVFTASAGPNFNRAKCPLQCKGHVKKGNTLRQCFNAQYKADTLCKMHIKKLSIK